MVSGCEGELCPNWSGDGRVCPCAVFDLEPPTPPQPRCELDYNPDGGNDGVCLARLDRHGNCTRRGGYHDDETGEWVSDTDPVRALRGDTNG
jgi:hypothetical protein